MPKDQQYNEIVGGKRYLEDVLGSEVKGFCYPGGKFDKTTIQCLEDAKISYARTTKNLVTDCPVSRFHIPTSFQFFPHRKSILFKNFLRHGPTLSRAMNVIRFSGVFEKSCGSGVRSNLLLQIPCYTFGVIPGS